MGTCSHIEAFSKKKIKKERKKNSTGLENLVEIYKLKRFKMDI